MADVANKYAENIAGTFYVDDQCIDCDLCRETAPGSFRRKRNDNGWSHLLYKQPETPEEENALHKKRWRVARSKRLATTAQSYSRLFARSI